MIDRELINYPEQFAAKLNMMDRDIDILKRAGVRRIPSAPVSSIIFEDTGLGMVGIDTSAPTSKLDINGNSIRVRSSSTPSSSTAAGATGTIAWDSNYVYVCVATNTWKRTSLASW